MTNNQQLCKNQQDIQHPHARADNLFHTEIYKEISNVKGAAFLLYFLIISLSLKSFLPPLEPFIIMQDFQLLLLVLLIDACAIIIRVSTGKWSTQAKLSLLASHLALLGQVAYSATNRGSE